MPKQSKIDRIIAVNASLRELGYQWIDIELFWKNIFEQDLSQRKAKLMQAESKYPILTFYN